MSKSVLQVIKDRQSKRRFSLKAVSKKKKLQIATAIINAPSAGNLKAFDWTMATNQLYKQEIAKLAYNQDWISNAERVFIFIADTSKNKEKYGRRAEFYAIQDATIACCYAQLTAESLGLATCWVGAFDEKKLHKFLGLVKHQRVVALLPIGHGKTT